MNIYDTTFECAELIFSDKFKRSRYILIKDDDDKVVDLISIGDLFKFETEQTAYLLETLKSYIYSNEYSFHRPKK